jgi:RimJ/RimL family protein N-acetyltransferase
VVGEVGLSAFDRVHGTAELGWWTAPGHRGLGVASAAAGLIVAWARRDLGLARVMARCPATNAASVAVARRAGLEVRSDEGGVVVLETT